MKVVSRLDCTSGTYCGGSPGGLELIKSPLK